MPLHCSLALISSMLQPRRPTRTRYLVVLSAMLAAVLLYLDRFCISFAEVYIKQELDLTDVQIGLVLSAFFWSYAICQVPSGWLSDRFGGRLMLTVYLLGWSLFTGLTGVAWGLMILLGMRLVCGVFQAGAYPTSANLVSKWVPFSGRGTASSLIAVGGRVGGVVAMLLTAYLIARFVPTSVSSELTPDDLLRAPEFCYRLTQDAAPRVPSIEKERDTDEQNRREAQRHVALRIRDRFSVASAAIVQRVAGKYQQKLDENNAKNLSRDQMASLTSPQHQKQLAKDLNRIVLADDFYDRDVLGHLPLPDEGKQYRRILDDGGTLEEPERTRLNRLLLEAAYQEHIKRVYVAGWRQVMWLYGSFGLIVAALLWYCLRDRPQDHPRCNPEERAVIEHGRPAAATQPHGKAGKVPLRQLVSSRSMWLICIAQFFTNVGWVFIVTWAPRYLAQHHRVPVEDRGWMTAIPIAVGWFGMLAGGQLTDRLVPWVGLRWGRALPMSLSRFMAMSAYLFVLYLYLTQGSFNPWLAVAAFSLVAFSTDLGAGATWAFKQDVGGRYVGSILGWGNMWGNFGATVAPTAVILIVGEENPNWSLAFITCAAAFFLSGIAALGVNATIPIAPTDEEDVPPHPKSAA